jgi:hypothetical protein
LHCLDIIPGFKEMGRKGVPTAMTTGWLGDICLADSGVHGPLQDQFVDMVPPDAACARIARHLGRRKDILPHPLVIGVRVFALQRVREVHAPIACREILGVEVLDVQQMLL